MGEFSFIGPFMRAPPPGSARPGSCAPRPLPPCGRYEPVGAVDPSVPAVIQETRHINHSLLRLHRTLTSLTRADVCGASNPGASVCVGGGGASAPPNPSNPGFHGGFHLRREGSDSVGWVAHCWSISFFDQDNVFIQHDFYTLLYTPFPARPSLFKVPPPPGPVSWPPLPSVRSGTRRTTAAFSPSSSATPSPLRSPPPLARNSDRDSFEPYPPAHPPPRTLYNLNVAARWVKAIP